MNEGRAAFLRVGLLVLGGIGLLIGLVLFFGGNRLKHGTVFESYFSQSVQGLEAGAPVKYRGVTLGRVTEIGLVAAEYGKGAPPSEIDREVYYRLVFVRYLVDTTRIGRATDTATAVEVGLRARLASQGLTGVAYLELDFADPDEYPAQQVPWTPEEQYIPSMPSTLQQVQNAATQLLAKLNRVDLDALSASLTGLVKDLRSNLDHGDVHVTLMRAAEFLHILNDTVTAADLPGLTADLRHTSSELGELAQDRDLHHTLANASAASDRLAAASAQLGPLIASLQAAARRTDNGVADLEHELQPILRDAQVAVTNLRGATEDLRRYPPQFLLADPPRRPPEPPK
jgi:ABC-type transporter Mla subunit MlaD